MPIPFKLLAVVAALLTLASPAYSTSAEILDPFLEMASATITITMGDGLDATPRSGERLFGNNDARRERFKERLASSLRARLAASGIRQEPDANSGLHVAVFGHAIPGQASGLDWVFYFDMSAHGPEPSDDPCWEGIDRARGLLGASSDEQLEDVLIEAIVRQLDQWLHKRDSRMKR